MTGGKSNLVRAEEDVGDELSHGRGREVDAVPIVPGLRMIHSTIGNWARSSGEDNLVKREMPEWELRESGVR
eukprot:1601815-Pleurochrysis_carterae.AAC.10